MHIAALSSIRPRFGTSQNRKCQSGEVLSKYLSFETSKASLKGTVREAKRVEILILIIDDQRQLFGYRSV